MSKIKKTKQGIQDLNTKQTNGKSKPITHPPTHQDEGEGEQSEYLDRAVPYRFPCSQ
jgi:hypothetical protein